MFAVQRIALRSARLLRSMVELETRRVLNVVVASVTEGVVRADNYQLATPGQLHRGKLFFVVLLECWAQLVHKGWVGYGDCFNVYIRGVSVEGGRLIRMFKSTCRQQHLRASRGQLGVLMDQGIGRRTSPGGASPTKEDTHSKLSDMGGSLDRI